MQIYILAGHDYAKAYGINEYDTIAAIDEQEDIVFNKRFCGTGYCALKVGCTPEMLDYLKRGNYIYRFDDDMFCKIKKVSLDTDVEQGDYLTVDAVDMNNILAGRIVRWGFVYSGTVLNFLEKLITENVINPEQPLRKIANFELYEMTAAERAEFTETIDVAKDTATQDLFQLVESTCKSYNYGFRVSFNINTRQLVFRLLRGKNKATMESEEYVEFSPNFANIISSHYEEDESDYKNVVYVGYKSANKDDENIYLHSVYEGQSTGATEPQGEYRREVYVDGTSTSREITLAELQSLYGSVTKSGSSYFATVDGKQTEIATFTTETKDGVTAEKITVTDFTYSQLIRNIGVNALAERTKKQAFGGAVDTIDTYIYKTDYNLGDIVKVANEYGIEAAAQITEVTESENADSPYSVEPTFEFFE